MEVKNQINIITNEISDLGGIDYAKQFTYSITEVENNIKAEIFHVIIDAMEMMTEDNKNKKINSLKTENKEIKTTLEDMKNVIKTQGDEIKELKKDNKEMKTTINYLLQRAYVVVLWQAYKNLEYYIIKKVTNYSKEQMNNVNTNLTEFCNNSINNKYVDKINELYNKYNIHKYSSSLGKINGARIDVAHPSPIDMEELKNACDMMKKDYNGIDELYNNYDDVYKYFKK